MPLQQATAPVWDCKLVPVSVCIPAYGFTPKLYRTTWSIGTTIDLPGCQLIIHAAKQSVAANRNACLRAARNDVICFVDDDVLLPGGWLSAFVATLQSWPAVGAVGPRITGVAGQAQNTMSNIAEDQRVSAVIPGTVLCYSRERVGGLKFDEDYEGSQWEDTDWCMQVRSMGLDTICLGNVHVLHDNGMVNGRGEVWERNKARFRVKWPGVLDLTQTPGQAKDPQG
jgi:glycosyltransferase involved in cell wall biosynthesis